MISMGRLLVEGRYDSLVAKLSKLLLNKIKSSFRATESNDGEYLGNVIYFNSRATAPNIQSESYPNIFEELVENETLNLDFYLGLRVQWIDNFKQYEKGADAFIEQSSTPENTSIPYIEIRFTLDPADVPNIYSKIAMDLRDSLRHEIEHITQTGWNLKPGKYLPSDMAQRSKIESGQTSPYKYFILKKEIPAMIHGLYLKAKKQRIPFSVVVNEYLQLFVDKDYITQKEKTYIIRTWQKELPKLGIRSRLY